MAPTISDEHILEAALDTIARHGYAGATTRKIATAAGINEVTLFRRFGSKKNLLLAAVEQEAAAFTAAGIDYSGDVEADLLRIVSFYRDIMQSRGPVIVMLLSEVPRQPELLDILETPFAIIARNTSIIERYQREGVLVDEPPLDAFVALVGPLFLGGVVGYVQPELSPVSFDPAEQVRRYLRGRRA